MFSFFTFIIGVAVGAVGMWFALKNTQGAVSSSAEELAGYHAQRRQNRETAKARIIAMLREKGEMRNNDVEQLLGVSDATATRYLEELEQEGVISQVGKTGRNVSYRFR